MLLTPQSYIWFLSKWVLSALNASFLRTGEMQKIEFANSYVHLQ